MSYNIDSIDIIGGHGLFIAQTALDAFSDSDSDKPGSWESPFGTVSTEAPGLRQFKYISWTGEFSGNGLGDLTALLGQTYGSADLLLCWEGGDSYTGLRVVNGVVTKHKIVMALGESEAGR